MPTEAIDALLAPGRLVWPRNREGAGLGLTQDQTAKVLRVNSWTIINWETGRHEPPMRSMSAILKFLGNDSFPLPTTLGELLLQVRRARGWSIMAAASQIGVAPTTWYDWERGELILFRKHRSVVAQFLGLDEPLLVHEMRARWNGSHRRREK